MSPPREILHYTGYTTDRGGIVAVIRALQRAGGFRVLHGVSPGFAATGDPLPLWSGPALVAEEIGVRNFFRARAVAREARVWLRGDPGRVFHGHSRAGLLVALWLHGWGERRVVVSVHCYGRQRWFYRWAAGKLGPRLFWLSPAMKGYYGVGDVSWAQCIPGGVAADKVSRAPVEPGRLRLGGVGALVRWKGWHTVVEALGLLTAGERARVTFTHIGGGDADYRGELERAVVAHGLNGVVEFRGAEPSAYRLLCGIDALVVASVNEPFSIAVLEALAAGVPVLAADSGGARDLIREGINGRLHRTGDAADLARCLREWLEQAPAWPVAQIRATTVTQEHVAAQWADVYAAL